MEGEVAVMADEVTLYRYRFLGENPVTTHPADGVAKEWEPGEEAEIAAPLAGNPWFAPGNPAAVAAQEAWEASNARPAAAADVPAAPEAVESEGAAAPAPRARARVSAPAASEVE